LIHFGKQQQTELLILLKRKKYKAPMNIYFAGSIRGGRAHQPQYEYIVRALENHGTVAARHVAHELLPQHGETALSNSEIHERECAALRASDVVVADVSTPSLGVGYLIAYAVAREKKVLVLYHSDSLHKLSAMIRGNEKIDVYLYQTEADVVDILRGALNDGAVPTIL
jgi:2'-deoxynucleoside 5'-phosphate N-hydrolase